MVPGTVRMRSDRIGSVNTVRQTCMNGLSDLTAEAAENAEKRTCRVRYFAPSGLAEGSRSTPDLIRQLIELMRIARDLLFHYNSTLHVYHQPAHFRRVTPLAASTADLHSPCYGISVHQPECWAVAADGDFASHLESVALVERQVERIRILQIGPDLVAVTFVQHMFE